MDDFPLFDRESGRSCCIYGDIRGHLSDVWKRTTEVFSFFGGKEKEGGEVLRKQIDLI